MRILILFLLSPFFLFAQIPDGISYQAVATDLNGLELTNQNISAETILPKGGLKPAIYILELKKEEDVTRRNLVVQ